MLIKPKSHAGDLFAITMTFIKQILDFKQFYMWSLSWVNVKGYNL